MLVQLLRKFLPTRLLIFRFAEGRATYFVSKLQPFLERNKSILDIGVGTGNVTAKLQADGFTITPLDVEDLSFVPTFKPIVYDGKTIPFAKDSFDTALILTVLHHTQDPDRIIQEAARVAKEIIIIEDVHNSRPHKFITQLMDSLLNLEFFGHPHNNRSDAEWRETFKRLGLNLKNSVDMRSFVVMRHKLYVLEHG